MSNFLKIFKNIKNLKSFKLKTTDKPVIDVERVRLFYSIQEAADFLGVTIQSIYRAISSGDRVKGVLLEYFEEWKDWDSKAKERYSEKFNIYFFDGGKDE